MTQAPGLHELEVVQSRNAERELDRTAAVEAANSRLEALSI